MEDIEEEPFLSVKGNVDMPGVLGGGQVDLNGDMTFSYGKIDRCEKTNDYSNQRFRHKIWHDIGHNRYMVNLTPVGSERMFGRVLEYNASYFVVDFFHAPEEDYQKSWRTPFMFTVIGSNT